MSDAPQCPSCGAPLPARNPGVRAQTCEYCGTISMWDEQGHTDSGKTSMLPEGFTRLFRGATGTLRGTRFEVLGRVRYGYDRGFWDEWYLRLEDGSTAWLTEDDHHLALETMRGAATVPTETLEVGETIPVDGTTYLIREVGTARGLGIEGQVARGVLPDETYGYADGHSLDGARTLGIEYDDDPPTVFLGERLRHEDVQLDDEGDLWRAS